VADADGTELREAFKAAAAAFPSGVAIVTSGDGSVVHGITVSAFSSLSLDPPQVLVCIARWSKINNLILSSNAFSVNILSSDQGELSDFFAKPGRDPVTTFTELEVPHSIGDSGCPVNTGVAAHFDCCVMMANESGDHSVFFGDVVAAAADPSKKPLLFYNRAYREIGEPRPRSS
jgi:flavin reductase (DIM6/NTAB) family NADH-FMN oxidoreductase RutF